ncbi:MAG: hypothetical protein Ct9H300mP28_33760 [Pseudomonadota bacterium]|nr:MAG: hypothetical protein Ct9H300mP28_33760 [Pseudomonadota bacterium]
MSSRNAYIEESIYSYLLENSLRELPVLKKLREETQKMPLGRMQISPDQGQFMAMLVRLIVPKKIIEVGHLQDTAALLWRWRCQKMEKLLPVI